MLSFSPSLCGIRVFNDWNPALMLCIRRRSLLLAISLRIRLSWSRAVSGVRGMLAKLGRKKDEKEQRRQRDNTKNKLRLLVLFAKDSYSLANQTCINEGS